MSRHPTLLGLYRPGTTVLHRAPAGVKMFGLLVFGTVILIWRSPYVAVGALAFALALVVVSRTDRRGFVRATRMLFLIAALLFAFQWWYADVLHAVQVVARLLAIVILATVVTATTSADDLLDGTVRALGPFRRIGVRPERVGLAIALMLRAIPNLLEVASESREAARARGLDRNLRALLVPMVIRSVAGARATGDALAARGIGDD